MVLAQHFPLEIISADAMMVYKGMDIGTAKPTRDERLRVPHHLIDVALPGESYSVQRFVAAANEAIAGTLARGNMPLVVGGTGFYLRALSEGLPSTPQRDPAWQQRLFARLEHEGLEPLLRELTSYCPADAERAQKNPRRVVRALEIWQRTGRSPTAFKPLAPRFSFSKRCLLLADEALAEAIAKRTERMFAAGLVAEVRWLHKHFPDATTALQAIGYKEVIPYLEGSVTRAECQRAVTQATLHYAKRQRTWFRKEPAMTPLLPAEAQNWLTELSKAAL